MGRDESGNVSAFCSLCEAWRGSLGLEPTPDLYVSHIVQIFAELRRVLRDDGTLWLNLGDGYSSGGRTHRRDPDSKNVPALQNFDRIGTPPGLKPKDLVGIPWRVAFALQADGWYLRSDIIWSKNNPMPEAVKDRPTKSHEYLFLLTKSAKYFYDAEAIKDPVTGNAHARGDGVNPKSLKSGYKVKQNPSFSAATNELVSSRNKRSVWTIPTHPFPEAHFATFPPKLIEPCILAGTSEKGCCPECGAPWERIVEKERPPEEVYTKTSRPLDELVAAGTRRDGVVRGSGQAYTNWKNEHPDKTTGWKPGCECYGDEYEMRSKKPCTVLDIFGGSGTTAIVSYKHGRRFVIIDLSKTYLDDIAIPRIKRETAQLKLF